MDYTYCNTNYLFDILKTDPTVSLQSLPLEMIVVLFKQILHATFWGKFYLLLISVPQYASKFLRCKEFLHVLTYIC